MSSPADADASSTAPAALRRLFWRVHFWAGLVTAPLVLFAALTGLLYAFAPQIEARVHADVDRVAATGQTLPLDAQINAARAAQPGWPVRSVTPAFDADETTQVLLAPPPAAHAQHAQGAARTERHALPARRRAAMAVGADRDAGGGAPGVRAEPAGFHRAGNPRCVAVALASHGIGLSWRSLLSLRPSDVYLVSP